MLQPELTFDSLTKNRMLMEKRYFLNNSNTKWVSVGIKPASKMLSTTACGFYVNVSIDGAKMAPMCVGGLEDFMGLCRIVRQFDEFKFAYSGKVIYCHI